MCLLSAITSYLVQAICVVRLNVHIKSKRKKITVEVIWSVTNAQMHVKCTVKPYCLRQIKRRQNIDKWILHFICLHWMLSTTLVCEPGLLAIANVTLMCSHVHLFQCNDIHSNAKHLTVQKFHQMLAYYNSIFTHPAIAVSMVN